ncbi:unnamed protein product, partial [Heterosigma akashiwo]
MNSSKFQPTQRHPPSSPRGWACFSAALIARRICFPTLLVRNRRFDSRRMAGRRNGRRFNRGSKLMLCLGLGLSVQRNWAVMAFLGSSTTIITSSKSLLTSKAYHLIYSGLDDGQEDERRNQDKHLADLSYITGQESQSSFHQKWLDHVASRKCVSSIDISRDYKIEYGLAAVGDEVYEYTAEGTTGKLLSEEYFGTKETLIGQKIVSVLPQHRRLNPLYPGKEPKAVPPHSQYPVYKCALCERKRNANFDGTVLLGDTEGKWGYFFDPHLQTQGFATLIPFDSIKK